MNIFSDSSFKSLPSLFFRETQTKPFSKPYLILWNKELANYLDIPDIGTDEFEMVSYLSGNTNNSTVKPIALAYAGHQFGHFTMLGDGRALLLGEKKGKNHIYYDIQLKGSGRTAFSRGGDGKATVTSMLREYLMSEAMYHLGISTTRSLAVVATGEFVTREITQPGAVLTRVAQSHLRVGTFEFAYQFGESNDVQALLEYAIQRHYPDLKDSPNQAVAFLERVLDVQSSLVVDWLRIGFIHGVMNTDNMSISGETIDYGPCAFMNVYDPKTVFSSIDTQGRYAFANQPSIAHWNLACLANALLPLISNVEKEAIEIAQSTLDKFSQMFLAKYWNMMAKKIGFHKADSEISDLVQSLLDWMKKREADYTNTFLALEYDLTFSPYSEDFFSEWKQNWKSLRMARGIPWEESLQLMQTSNPTLIPRNHLVEDALEKARLEDFSHLKNLLERQKNPYERAVGFDPTSEVPAGGDHGYVTYCGT